MPKVDFHRVLMRIMSLDNASQCPNHTKFTPIYLSFYANLKLKFHALKLPTATTFWYQNVPWTLKFMFQSMNFCIHLYFAKQNKHKLFVAMKIAGCLLNGREIVT